MSDALPNRWVRVEASEVCTAIPNGSTPKADKMAGHGEIPFVKVYNLTFSGKLDFSKTPTFISRETHEHLLARSRALPGDVLMNIVGPPLGKVSILPGTHPEWNFNQAIVAFRPKPDVLNASYLKFYLLHESDSWSKRFAKATAGQHNVSVSACRAMQLPLAPFSEQKRIADKLDALLARVDACRERLDRVPGILKRFRQSVLAAATSGELTREWREERERSLDDWQRLRIRDVVTLKNGRAFPSSEYGAEGIRLLRPGNLNVSGRVEWDANNTRRMPVRYADEFPDFVLGPGELLMNLTAQSLKDEFLGRVCLKADDEPALLNQRICAFYPVLEWDVRPYLFLYFKSPSFRSYVDTLDSGTLIKHMHSKQLLEHELSLPPRDEAEEICRRAASLLTVAEEVERRLASAVHHSTRLPNALLAKAFRGELVPQDPTDEPASALLARLTSARQQTETRPPRPKKAG